MAKVKSQSTAPQSTPAPAPVAATPAPAPAAPQGETASETYQKKMSKLPPAKRLATKIRNSLDRIIGYSEQLAKWGQKEMSGDITEAGYRLKETADALAELPDEWRPSRAPRGEGGGSVLEIGQAVTLREKTAAQYDDLIDGDERKMKVAGLRGKRVLCETPSGVKVLIPRGHLAKAA